jgi:rhamnogalacturonyl hydrolase YesR
MQEGEFAMKRSFLFLCLFTLFLPHHLQARPFCSSCSIEAVMKKVADWQLANPNHAPTDWTNGALYTGIMALYLATEDDKYLNALLSISEGNKWNPGPRPRHADDHAVTQTYLELYMLKGEQRMIAPTIATFDQMMAEPQPGRVDWWWCDALFMAPPALARLGAATGNTKYFEYMDKMWWDTTEYLYDPAEALFFRDANYFNKKEKNGKKVFWSRGNGWVLAGTARVLDFLPDDYPTRARYEQLFQQMAARIKTLQQSDGFWRPSLLDPGSYQGGESSGTGFYTYALAWGVNNKLLKRGEYEETIRKGWEAMVGAVDENGRLGWVQPIGYKPEKVGPNDTDVYGVGAFLLAGSELLKMETSAP